MQQIPQQVINPSVQQAQQIPLEVYQQAAGYQS